jgi:hypothetical protein
MMFVWMMMLSTPAEDQNSVSVLLYRSFDLSILLSSPRPIMLVGPRTPRCQPPQLPS